MKRNAEIGLFTTPSKFWNSNIYKLKKFRAFYNKHKDKLFAYLMRMTGDYYLSSDIMQESFTRYLEHYGHEKQSVALLYTIGRNSLIDNARKQNRNRPLQNDQEDCAVDQESALMVRDEYRKVLSALQNLKKIILQQQVQ